MKTYKNIVVKDPLVNALVKSVSCVPPPYGREVFGQGFWR